MISYIYIYTYRKCVHVIDYVYVYIYIYIHIVQVARRPRAGVRRRYLHSALISAQLQISVHQLMPLPSWVLTRTTGYQALMSSAGNLSSSGLIPLVSS